MNEDLKENEIEEDEKINLVNISLNKKPFTSKIYNNFFLDEIEKIEKKSNKNNRSIDSLKLSHNISIDKNKFLPSEFEPVFEEEEKDFEKTEDSEKKKTSARLKIIKDSKEDSFTLEPKGNLILTNIYDNIIDAIEEEDLNENFTEQELKSSKSLKKIESFKDKLDHIEEINDLVIDTFNIESIKEEINEEEEFDKKMNISGYMQFEDESEKLNYYKTLSKFNLNLADGEDDIIFENENDENDL